MNRLTRREFMALAGRGAALLALPACASSSLGRPDEPSADRPNIILCMSDDQGWGDTGYNGHPVLETPNLDAMSREGIRFERFYAGAPVCSPTRGSCLTGRHPYRYGIVGANKGHMLEKEVTLAELLRDRGYTTGHFGKWHLGTLTAEIKDSNRGKPGDWSHYAPPWEHGFDVCFSTEAKVPTWDPMIKPGTAGEPYGTYYWTGSGERAEENLDGDDSRVIMDRVIPFLRQAASARQPFFAVIWFHAPHLPCVAGPRHLDMYDQNPFLACITAMDEQVGRLRQELDELGVAGNTMLWFCADNGPEGKKATGLNGSAGNLRGRKRSLYEGGVRVPGLLVWPDRIDRPRTVEIPCSTSDYFPTVCDVIGLRSGGQPEPLDGISLVPLLDGTMAERPGPIAFESGKQVALIDNRFKIYSRDSGATFELYDLVADPSENVDLAERNPAVLTDLRNRLEEWRASCRASRDQGRRSVERRRSMER